MGGERFGAATAATAGEGKTRDPSPRKRQIFECRFSPVWHSIGWKGLRDFSHKTICMLDLPCSLYKHDSPMKAPSSVISLKTAHEVAFSPSDNRVAYIGGRDITVLDVHTRKTLFAVHPIANPSHIDFSPDGNRLVVKGTSGRTIVLDALTGCLLSDFKNQKEGEGDSALFSACGRFIASVSWLGLFSVRDWVTAEVTFSQIYPSTCWLGKICTTADRSCFFYTIDHPPRTSDGFTPSTIAVRRWPIAQETADELPKEWTAIWGLQVSPSGRFLAVIYGTPPNMLEIYDIAGARTITHCAWSGSPGCSIAWSRDETILITNGNDNFLMYDVPNLTVRHELPVQYPCFVQFSPSEKHVALGSWKKSFIVPTDCLAEFERSRRKYSL